MTVAALLLAAVSPFLPWISFAGFNFAAIGDDLQLRVAKWMDSTSSIDGFLVLGLAAAGLAALGAALFAQLNNAVPRMVLAILTPVLTALTGLEYQYILSQEGGKFSNIGWGLHALGVAVILLMVARFVPAGRGSQR